TPFPNIHFASHTPSSSSRSPPPSPLFPYTTLFRSLSRERVLLHVSPQVRRAGADHPRRRRAVAGRLVAARRPPAAHLDRGVRRRSEEHTSELQSHLNLVCRLLLEKNKSPYTEKLHG